MNKKNNLSQADKKAWEDYVKNPNDIYDKDNSKTGILERNYRFKFDLHGLTLDKANKKVKEIISDKISIKSAALSFCTFYSEISTVIPGAISTKQLLDNLKSISNTLDSDIVNEFESLFENEIKDLKLPW